MGWRARHQERLLTAFGGQAEVKEISHELPFQVRAYQNRSDTCQIGADKQEAKVLLPVPDSYEVRVSRFRMSSHIAALCWEHKRRVFLSCDGEEAAVHVINLSMLPGQGARFSFRNRKHEPQGSLFSGTRQAKRRLAGAKLQRPPKTSPPQGLTLEERLRWMLTPPVNELLSDPQLCLPAHPFPYQTLGIWWLYERTNALLADEMGLGKTMQAIIAARLLWRERFITQILIICPKTLIPTWRAEIDKWWPQISGNVMLPGNDRQFFLRVATPNVVVKIINYEAVAREADWLDRQLFSHDLIIIDEAQRIKNSTTKTSQAIRSLHADRRWALTGTPLENRVDDVCSIFHFVKPGVIGDTINHEAIRSGISPFILRRRTEDVIHDLPEKSEQDSEIELSGSQRHTYDRMEADGVLELNAKGESITVTHVFALIARLRQICNFDPVNGVSGKLERLLADLEEVRDSGRKALVFSQFVDERYGLQRLAAELKQAGYKVLELHGGVRQNLRQAVIDRFQNQADMHVLLLNYQVGGVGLNLQAANYVFLFDRWWNPAVEDQAVKRVHRIGQASKVFIRKFYCSGTIEERILKKLADKRRLFRNIIDQACPEPDSLGLTEEEIFSLFNLSVRPKKSSAKSSKKVKVNIDGMDPEQFEELTARIYEGQGFHVQRTGRSHDGGIDLLAERTSAGACERVVVQCKHQQSNVGRPILQQLWGVVSSDQSYTRGDLVTSASFTSEATAFAQGRRLTLIDRTLLIRLAREVNVADFPNE